MRVSRIGLSLGAVGVTTWVCASLGGVNASTAGFAYLVGILAIAASWGRTEAVTASVAAVLCYNFFFLPPVGVFMIADPQNWVALFTFLVTALVASHLSDRAKRQAQEAHDRQRETEQLYALSRAILLTDASKPIGPQAVRHIGQVFECPSVALHDATTGEVYRGGEHDIPAIEEKLKQVAVQGGERREEERGLIVAAVTLGGKPIGSLAIQGIALSNGALQALLNLVAIALERVRTEEAASRAEVARQSEEFKSTLLDAIAHEFKTPLTSIKAASTSILSEPGALTASQQELTTIIDEEANRLSQLVTEAVRMSQIDAGKVKLEKRVLRIDEELERVMEQFGPRLEGREVRVRVEEGLAEVRADGELIALAVRQLVDNSLKYTPASSPVEITAEAGPGIVLIRVRDRGPGIPERERDRLFDKFYRRHGAKERVPGSGLGLYIAREIARAHGGDLWIEGEAGQGSDFCLELPAGEKGGQ
ncbi:MAG: DUF4118 domain-containing protein [Acidobacteria bacterium]|nr:DUF4118 domain-containing protein [Acidobacteriota bacterium]